MKKWSKAIAIGLCVCMVGTAAIAETAGVDAVSSSTRTTQSQQTQGNQNQQTPPSMPNQQMQDNQNQQMMPPAMPGQQGQGGQNQQMTPPSMPNQQMQDNQNQRMMPPAMPGQQGQGSQNQQTPPSMPDQQGQGGQNQQMPPAMPNQQSNNMMTVQTGNNGKLNMRQEPQAGAKLVDQYANGTQVEVLEVSGEWVKVRINGKTGYMMVKFLEGDLPDTKENTQENERPEIPDGQNGERPEIPGDQNGERPELPGDENVERPELPGDQNGERPELPGDQNGERPELPGDENGERPELPGDQNGERPGEIGGMPDVPDGIMIAFGGLGGENAPSSYIAANTVTESTSGASYTSTGSGENAVLVSQGNVTLSSAAVSKTGSSSSESADFYGSNAAVLATGGSTLTIEDAEITSDGGHANGVFSYGSGTTVNVSGTTITTNGNNSGGLMTTGGATLNAANVTVATSGNSSAAIRSDRGGGTVNVSGGSYDTTGVGSPAIYSTADITVSDASLSAATSEAVVIEGGNTVTLNNVDITGSNTKLNGQSTVKTNVLIYQSMSGDASEGASSFTMTDSSMTAETGAMFHVTNTTTTITLENVNFTYASDSNVFLDASADSWGKAGSNGGNVTLNLKDQDITGSILTDSVSAVSVNLDADSTWTLTGDSYVTSFTGDLNNVNLNGYTLYVNGVAVTK